MTIEPGSVEHLSQLISHVLAPAFLLAVVAGFVSLLSDRLMAVVARVRELSSANDGAMSGENRSAVIARLERRAVILNVAILFGLMSGLSVLVLITAAFGAALLDLHHVWLAAILFATAAFFLLCSVVTFGVDARIAITGHDLH